MVNQPKAPLRTFRISDELYHAAKREGVVQGETLTDVVRRAFQRYVDEARRSREPHG